MPVEIRELQIKVTVNQPEGQTSAQAASSSGEQKKDDKETLINQCVEQVLEILNNKKER